MWRSILDRINKLTEDITALFLLIMVLLVFVKILTRVLFQSSFPWTEELSRYLMIWITFLGASIAFKYAAHIGFDLIVNKLPGMLKKIFQVISAIACLTFFILLIVKGYELCGRSMVQSSPALDLPMAYVYAIIPISGILMSINLVDTTINKMRYS
ncbi:C4-dicarboxylate ABC transporter permease [Pontibacillus chungwhensis BH030062]|uniref:C4-dicarboxylate ABC transporter permease n=1 Tax=Pontibacillus chungwhensis BH030062 TaxID=1385513 RepID=A0A0A2UVU2_9BACI|nr:TRAP transporter small permease [Pontibacillus chungwhensis]KGP90636.1 C4-dicarboxylate ABC transporter permease [Pontibacillus chungwhensis BH030062]